MTSMYVHERMRAAADVLDSIQCEPPDSQLASQIMTFRIMANHLEIYGAFGVPGCWIGWVAAADAILT